MFYLDMASGVPVYLQIAAGIRAERLSGRYRTGDRIPPVRELALALRVNPNTVAKAYRYLQEEGFLESRPGGGNYIAPVPSETDHAEREAHLSKLLDSLLRETDALQIQRSRVEAVLKQKLNGEERKDVE